MKKNIAYLRVSSQGQTLENQRQAIEQYCKNNNIIIDAYYSDDGVSAYSVDANKREGLNAVRELARKKEVEKLIIFESSRISRRHLVGQIIISELSNNDVEIVSITEGVLNSNEIDNLLNSIRMYSNESSSKLTSQRVSNAKSVMAKDKRYLGGRILTGYKKEGRKLGVDESLREVMVNMFKIYASESAKASLKYLKENGLNKTNQTLLFMLKNTTYIGRYYKTEDNKDIYTPELRIISDELFYDVQEKIHARANKKNNEVVTDRTHCLAESLAYHSCGRKMYLSIQNAGNCYRSRCNCINQKSFRQTQLDEIVSDKVSTWFYRLDKKVLEEKFNSSRNTELKQLLVRELNFKNLLKTKQTTLENANKKLTEAFLKDFPLDMIQILTDNINGLKTSIRKIEDDISKVNEKIANQKLLKERQEKISEQLLDFKYLYDHATPKEKKMLVRAVVDKIIITNWENIQIVYKY